MGTPLVWSLTVAVVVVAIFALLPATMALAVQKSFKYYKLKITWLRAMFDVHMCVFFFQLLLYFNHLGMYLSPDITV